ncbi:paraquat-inducible protein A [Paraburkholderia sp. BL6665CI2N2]|uniref:paraquat-inducible protein A n=1 Tax=Paraburkholderia sp. BL6665CI2N2 TaxID=1938806 RepID=UPI001065A845|nr:paraquat-inducible protein A [Paraburkholderia sp. BL6665CI2N2]TDY23076.1 paraquat-inducible protein A [Paraburkholderia sp. BL6665CI2N2]TDY27147.1 paraquat-inducible protein A [Paraburkholderia sp. BL6665CI2N2]
MEYKKLIACHECDLLFRKPLLRDGQAASCSRCRASLEGTQGASVPLDRIGALTVAALITFCIAQAFPVIQLQTNGMTSEATLLGAVWALWTGHMRIVATMVLCSAILFPLIELLALLYVLVPLRLGKVVRHFNRMLRVVQIIRPWGMVEVFMLGVVITIVKMVSMAQVIPGPGLFAFGALTLMLAFLGAFDPRVLWSARDEIKLRQPTEIRWTRVKRRCASRRLRFFGLKPAPAVHWTARRAGLVACHTCGLVQKHIAGSSDQRCSRCESMLHTRHPDSVTRTSSLVLAAALAYIPANLLPIMHAASLGHSEDDTILGGVAYFWTSGDWPLAVVVFVASVVVPMLKLAILTLQIVAARCSPDWQPLERARLHRLVECVGRWSMLDVFVVALTVALVHFGSFAVVTAGPGALAFGAVVILTMLASHQFDPRLIWDNVRCEPARGSRP